MKTYVTIQGILKSGIAALTLARDQKKKKWIAAVGMGGDHNIVIYDWEKVI